MVKVFQETVKSPVRRQRQGNIKTIVVYDEKVVVEIIDKIGNQGEAFTFHYNKGTDHGMVGKAFVVSLWVFRNGRQIEMQEKVIIKFSNGLDVKRWMS